MIVIHVNPVAFSIGPFHIHWYGLMYVVGITVGLLVARPYARAKGLAEDKLITIVTYALPAGLIGARLYYVLQQPLAPYLAEPWRILAFWEGGMAFYGAVFAVILTIIILTRRMKVDTWQFLDAAALFASVGQFFGRIGNLINGDIIGYPTTLPWGIVYANPNSFPPRHDIAYQPAAVYEAIGNMVLFAILWSMRNRVKPGTLTFIYIFGYSIAQIIIFTWRDNAVVFLGLKQAQLTALGVIIAAIPVFLWYLKRLRGVAPSVAGP